MHILEAKEILIARQDTHLDSLAERLREPRIKAIIKPMLHLSNYRSSITLAEKYSKSLDFVGVKHCGDQSIVKAESVYTAMLHPFSLSRVTKERYGCVLVGLAYW